MWIGYEDAETRWVVLHIYPVHLCRRMRLGTSHTLWCKALVELASSHFQASQHELYACIAVGPPIATMSMARWNAVVYMPSVIRIRQWVRDRLRASPFIRIVR